MVVRVLQVATRDVTVKKLLLPLIDRLTAEGYQVISACAPGRYTPELMAQGYSMRPIDIDRRISPKSNARSIWQLYRLMRREAIEIVHVHTPMAATLGRLAGLLAGVPIIIYTAHGFYFHDHMSWRTRMAHIWLEKILARGTDMMLSQSQEDLATAVRERICPADKVVWIGNGVDTRKFEPGPSIPAVKESFGLPGSAPVVGFMGRMVAEKGVVELVKALKQALTYIPNLHLLMVGDIIDGERDRKTLEEIRMLAEAGELATRIVFTGYIEGVTRVMQAIDLFVLPSHREGMPRSIIEAMASGKPVIASNIRGCREEVVRDLTGLLVPVGDSEALSQAIVRILSDPELACRMGNEGRRRAEALFDEHAVLDRQVRVYQHLVSQRLSHEVIGELPAQALEVEYREIGEIDEP